VFRHIVLIKLKPDAQENDISTFLSKLKPISEDPNANNYLLGKNFYRTSVESDNTSTLQASDRWDMVISCQFKDAQGLKAYMDSPEHAPPGALLSVIAENFLILQYEELLLSEQTAKNFI
tara:strand:- start:12825 stop:13184 length:360 start_codon:yes stop_codon:yes gene_type:complete